MSVCARTVAIRQDLHAGRPRERPWPPAPLAGGSLSARCRSVRPASRFRILLRNQRRANTRHSQTRLLLTRWSQGISGACCAYLPAPTQSSIYKYLGQGMPRSVPQCSASLLSLIVIVCSLHPCLFPRCLPVPLQGPDTGKRRRECD